MGGPRHNPKNPSVRAFLFDNDDFIIDTPALVCPADTSVIEHEGRFFMYHELMKRTKTELEAEVYVRFIEVKIVRTETLIG